MTVYLSLGSNLGDRKANLNRALELLQARLGTAPKRVSAVLETPAWGFEGPAFLNCAASFELDRSWTPTRLLDATQAIERRMGRRGKPEWDAAGRRVYHDRPIDIDLLFWGTKTVRTTRLNIPHPLIAERDFVLIPLREIADDAIKEAFPAIFETK